MPGVMEKKMPGRKERSLFPQRGPGERTAHPEKEGGEGPPCKRNDQELDSVASTGKSVEKKEEGSPV